jgi:hypothetical protein
MYFGRQILANRFLHKDFERFLLKHFARQISADRFFETDFWQTDYSKKDIERFQ